MKNKSETIDKEVLVKPDPQNADITKEKLSDFCGYKINEFLNAPKRIWELDFLRGVCIILMIFDHLFFFGCEIFGYALTESTAGQAFVDFCYYYIYDSPRKYIHLVVLFFFFALCGISCSLSRSNFKRGVLLALIATAYSLISFGISKLAIADALVNYGVLNFLATCIIIYAIMEFALKKVKFGDLINVCVCAVISFVTLALFFYYTPPKNLPIELGYLFPTKYFDGLHFIDFKCHTQFSQFEISPADFFPFVPYASFFFTGVVIGKTVYKNKKSLLPKLDGGWNTAVNFIGRHTLVVYVLHIVAIVILLDLVCLISTGKSFVFSLIG